MEKNKIICIIQARYSSTRFPGKILKKINKTSTCLEFLITRLKKSKLISKIVIACSNNKMDKKIIDICKKMKTDFFVGLEQNVLDRYYKANKSFNGDIIIRITSDCPLMDPKLIDDFIKIYSKKNVDYVTNILSRTYPDGLDIEIFNKKSLFKAWKNSYHSFDKEHVTPYLRNNKKIKKYNISFRKNFSENVWALDYKEDLVMLKKIVKYFHPRTDFSWKEVLELKKKNRKIFKINDGIKRSIDIQKNPGQMLWHEAKNYIPGGNNFLSKRPEMFLPSKWPTYFKKAKGCVVTDLKGKKYYDFNMGVGTNFLGYSNNKVDLAVKKAIDDGNMSSLNCTEEVLLAKKLIDLHKWSGGVKFAKTGAEANAIALRIARCYNQKYKIAFCGYHGWQDWYLSSNLNNKNNLNEHLLKDLKADGVPKNLKNTVFPFRYKKFNELKKISKDHKIGVIVMEFSRNQKPDINFLKKVRKFASQKKIVLIFDECTSGFRHCLGGFHKKFNINPDIATFGKCLGNGYSITAVVGKKEIMNFAQESFISSTFFSERIGFVAGLKTIQILEKEKPWKKILKLSEYYKKKLILISRKYNIQITISGLPAIINFSVKSDKDNIIKTYITQEMLKKGFIFNGSIYLCTAHNKEIIDKFFSNLIKVFSTIKINKNASNLKNLLEGPVSHSTFRRLN